MYKKRHSEKLTFRDYIALMKMSMRGWIWRHEGDSFVDNLRRSGSSLAWMLAWYVIIGLSVGALGYLITGIPVLIFSIFKGKLFSSITGYLSLILVELLIFDPKKVKRSLAYTRSAWWNNTGIHPTEVVNDAGTYGEYAATMRIQEELERSGVFGKIYNSVLIPIMNHGTDTYAESDIVLVTDKSIQLFEVKNHKGRISGSFRYEADTWYRNEEYDPNNKYGNPLRQNQHHINYLIEYLYPLLKEKGLLNENDPFFKCFVNAVMYTVNRYGAIELDFTDAPEQTFLCFNEGGPEEAGYNVEIANGIARGEPGRAAAQEICAILDGLTDMDPLRHKALVGNKVMTDIELSSAPGYGARYSAVKGSICGHQNIRAVERSTGEHVWYDLRRDHVFWAIPEFIVESRSEQQGGEEGYKASLAMLTQQV